MRTDLTVTTFATYEDLESYMYGAASTIALQILPILQPVSSEAYDHIRSFGLALQLTNIVRDIGEDLERGRIYLPVEDLSRFNVELDDLHARRTKANFRNLLAFEISRARALYTHTQTGMGLLPASSRSCLELGIALYGDTLNAIESSDYRVLENRPRVSLRRRLRIAIPAFLRAAAIRQRDHTPPVTPALPPP
jgi:phytoene synthase